MIAGPVEEIRPSSSGRGAPRREAESWLAFGPPHDPLLLSSRALLSFAEQPMVLLSSPEPETSWSRWSWTTLGHSEDE